MPIHVEIVSREKKLFEEKEADMVLVPGVEGQMGILPNHSPLISLLSMGELVIRKGNAEEHFAVFGGVVEVRPNKVMVLANEADFVDDIMLQEMEEARQRAAKMLEEGGPPEDEQFYAQELKRAELAINIARRNQGGSGGMRIRVLGQDEDA